MPREDVLFNLSASYARSIQENNVGGNGFFPDTVVDFEKTRLEENKKALALFLDKIGVANMNNVTLDRLTRNTNGKRWISLKTSEDFLLFNSFIAGLNACNFIGESDDVALEEGKSLENNRFMFSEFACLIHGDNSSFIRYLNGKLKRIHYPVMQENILNSLEKEKVYSL